MTIADLSSLDGRTFPARRFTRNLVGGAIPIQAAGFSMGYVTLDPNGGQAPWHNQEQEEVYFIVKGVQLAELGLESWRRRAWVDVPNLSPWRTPACRVGTRADAGRSMNERHRQ